MTHTSPGSGRGDGLERAGQDSPSAAGIPAAAALLAGSVLLSRLLGVVREMLLAGRFGASAEADAYYVAFQIPDILNYFLAGGALSMAFLPLYTRVRSQQGDAAADRLLATVLGTLTAVMVLATALLWWRAEALVALQFPNFDAAAQALTVRLTRIVLPAQIFFLVGAVIQAALLARGRFLAAALAPVIYSGCIVGVGFFLSPRLGVAAFAWGALLGALLGPFLTPWLDTRGRARVRIRVAPFDAGFRHYLWLALPLMVGLGLSTVDEWYDRWFGALHGEGSVAYLIYARRLMQAPVGVVGQALGAAALPTLAHLWARGRREELDRTLLRTLQAALAVGLVAGAATWALSAPVVEAIYRRGAFSAEDATRVASLLRVFAWAVSAWVLQQIAVRAFYARSQMWPPALLGTSIALAAVPLYLALGEHRGVTGLALAGALAMSLNALATLLLARWRHGGPLLSPLLGTGARAVAVAALSIAATRAALGWLGAGLGPWLQLAAGAAIFGGVAAVGIATLADAPVRDALRGALARLRRRRPAA